MKPPKPIKQNPRLHLLLPRPIPTTDALSLPITPSYYDLTGPDVVYFDAFRHEVIHDVAGIGYADFWTRTVMCESLTDECIRNEIMAIGGLALSKPDFFSGNSSALIVRSYQQAALLLHGKALSTFNRRMAAGDLEPRSVLLFTILLAVFELMNENPSAAGVVIARGYRLLGSHFADAEPEQVPATMDAYPSPGLENIKDLKHIWLRLPCMTCLLPFVPPDVRSDMIKATKSISSVPNWDSDIDKISRSWREVSVQHLQVGIYAQTSAQSGSDQEANLTYSRSDELIDLGRHWSEVLERRIAAEKDPQILWSLRLMRVEQLNLLILGDISHRTLPSDVFKDLVHYCDDLLTESKRNALKTRMTTHGGVLPVLSSIIQLCKYPDVRKLAIATVAKHDADYRTMLPK